MVKNLEVSLAIFEFQFSPVRNRIEAGLPGATVLLFDGPGSLVGAQLTDASGGYGFFSGLTPGADYMLRFFPPPGYVLTLPDQGGDDTLDSDADLLAGETPFVTIGAMGPTRWDAGMIPLGGR